MRKNYTVKFKRKRKLKTNYKKRLEQIKSKKTRLVIRKYSKTILAQLINYETKGDKTLLLIKSQELKKLGWKYNIKNIPAAYLTGLLLGTKAKKLKINEAITDLGLQRLTKNSVIYATLNGAIDSGLKIPHDKSILLPKEKINGSDLAKNAKNIKNKNQFLSYNKNNIKIEDIKKNFDEVKSKILKNG